jgi:oleate hydratase
MMPFITSQFLRRDRGDRPMVIPERAGNFAFVGQFCELPDDVVFTVEYSVRSAQTAVYSLLGLKRTAPPVFKGSHNWRILLEAFRAYMVRVRKAVDLILVPVSAYVSTSREHQ